MAVAIGDDAATEGADVDTDTCQKSGSSQVLRASSMRRSTDSVNFADTTALSHAFQTFFRALDAGLLPVCNITPTLLVTRGTTFGFSEVKPISTSSGTMIVADPESVNASNPRLVISYDADIISMQIWCNMTEEGASPPTLSLP